MGSTLDYIAEKFGVDIDRKSPIELFNINREIMAQTLCELDFKVGVEVGVQQGYHSETLCKNNPGLKLYCIDPWVATPGYSENDDQNNTYLVETRERLAPYDCVLIRKFSMDTIIDFDDESLDFVYIDGAHDFKNIADDLCEWSKKVKRSGIVFGHDYKRDRNLGIKRHVVDVVNAYMYAYGINPWFILGEKGPYDGLYREGTRSWMYIKS